MSSPPLSIRAVVTLALVGAGSNLLLYGLSGGRPGVFALLWLSLAVPSTVVTLRRDLRRRRRGDVEATRP
jgi:hypothetical protein